MYVIVKDLFARLLSGGRLCPRTVHIGERLRAKFECFWCVFHRKTKRPYLLPSFFRPLWSPPRAKTRCQPNDVQHCRRSHSSSPPVPPSSSLQGGEHATVLRRTSSDRAVAEHALWHGGQLLQLQPLPPSALQQAQTQPLQQHQQHQQQHQQHQQHRSQYAQLLSPQPPQPPSPAAVGGVWGQAGPGGLAQRLQGHAPRSNLAPPQQQQQQQPPPPPMQVQQQQAGVVPPPPGPGGIGVNMGMGAGTGMMLNVPQHMGPASQVTAAVGYGLARPPPPPRPPPQGAHDASPFLGIQGQACGSPHGYGLGGDGGGTGGDGGVSDFAQQQRSQTFSVRAGGGGGRNAGGQVGGGGGGHGFGLGAGVRAGAQEHQGYCVSGCHHGHVQGDPGQVSHQSHANASLCAGGQGGNAGMSWASGVVSHGSHGGGGGHDMNDAGKGVARQPLSKAGGTIESLKPPPKHHMSFGQRSAPHSLPPTTPAAPTTAQPLSTSDPIPGDTVNMSSLPVPIPASRELRRQSSLPPLSGVQPVLTPARMAQTPPAALSRLAFLSGERSSGGAADEGPHADAAAAAAVAAVAGGAAEAWERERSRLSVSTRGSSPAESRIAAVAIAAQKTAEAAASASASASAVAAAAASVSASVATQQNKPKPLVAGAGNTAAYGSLLPASTATTESVLTGSALVPAGSVADSAAQSAAVAVAESAVKSTSPGLGSTETARYTREAERVHGSGRGGGGRGDGGGAGGVGVGVEVALEELSLGGAEKESGDKAALPGLSDFVSSGHR